MNNVINKKSTMDFFIKWYNLYTLQSELRKYNGQLHILKIMFKICHKNYSNDRMEIVDKITSVKKKIEIVNQQIKNI